MKPLFIILAFITTSNLFSQNLIGKQWCIDSYLGEDLQTTDVYFLSKPNDSSKYTNCKTRVTFLPNGTFSSTHVPHKYQSCIIILNYPTFGTYKQPNNNYIDIYVDRMDDIWKFSGGKDSLNLIIKKDLGRYYIHQASENDIYLIKSEGSKEKDLKKAEDVAHLVAFSTDRYRKKFKITTDKVQISDIVPEAERLTKIAKENFHLTKYQVIKVNSNYLLFQFKDLNTGAYHYAYCNHDIYKHLVTFVIIKEQEM